MQIKHPEFFLIREGLGAADHLQSALDQSKIALLRGGEVKKKIKVFARGGGPFLLANNNFYYKSESEPHGLNENWILAPGNLCYFKHKTILLKLDVLQVR